MIIKQVILDWLLDHSLTCIIRVSVDLINTVQRAHCLNVTLFTLILFKLHLALAIAVLSLFSENVCKAARYRRLIYVQFATIQRHQARERIFSGPVLLLHPCWE